MSGAGAPAVGALVALFVLVLSLAGVADVPAEAYGGMVLLLVGLALLAWGREGES